MELRIDAALYTKKANLPDGYLVEYKGAYLMQPVSSKAICCIGLLLKTPLPPAPTVEVGDVDGFFAWCDSHDLWIKLLL